MRRCLPKCLIAMVLVLAAIVAVVAFGASVAASRPDATVRGYTRLLRARAAPDTAGADRISDCLMATALLRGQGGRTAAIPEPQFKALRDYCRVAGAGHAPARPTGAGQAASNPKAHL